MATLTTTAVIRAHDQLTGPLSKMAAHVGSLQGRFSGMGRAISSGTGKAAASAGVVGFGLAGIVRNAQEANDALAAMGFATLFDNVRKEPLNAVNATLGEMDIATGKVVALSEELGQTPGTIARISAALKQAGLDAGNMAEASRAVGLGVMADPKADIEVLSKYSQGVLGLAKSFNQLRGATEGQFVTNAVGGAAAVGLATPWGAGEFIKAKSDQMALGFAAGLSSEQQDALLGVAAAGNQQPDVASTTIRSNIQRILSPTPQQQKAWRDSGLKRGDFVNEGAMDTTRTLQALRAMAMGRLDAKEMLKLEKDISAAKLDGRIGTSDYADHIQARLGKMLGLDMSMEQNVDAVGEMWSEAATRGGMKVDLEGFFRAVAAKGEDGQALLGNLLEPKRRATNLAILAGFVPDPKTGKLVYDQMYDISKNGAAGMEKGLEFFMKSSNTVGKRVEAGWGLFNFRLANSEAMLTFLENLNAGLKGVNNVVKDHPQMANYAVAAGLAGTALSLLAVPARGLGMLLSPVGKGLAYVANAAMGLRASTAAIEASSLFALSSQKANGVAAMNRAAASNTAMLAGMGLQAQQSQRMIQGMSAAAAASVAPMTAGMIAARGLFSALMVGAAIPVGTMLAVAYWKELTEIIEKPHKFSVVFPEAPKWISWLLDQDAGGFATLDKKVHSWRDDRVYRNLPEGVSSWMTDDQEFQDARQRSLNDRFGGGLDQPLTLLPQGPAEVTMSEGSASTIGGQIAAAVRAAVGAITINAPASQPGEPYQGRGGKAQAPLPRVSNGPGYNGGN